MGYVSQYKERAEAVIPGGMYGHQNAAMLTDNAPQYFSRAEGATLWDDNGKAYLDYLCAYGPNLLGYHQPDVTEAFLAQLRLGDTMTGPAPVMVELAEAMVAQVKHADWAMFCKNGTDATTMAMMVARNYTKRRTILVAKGAYHGAAPWCTPVKNGTTSQDRANQIFYTYNDVESLEEAVRLAGDDLAAIFGSPIKHDAFVDQEYLNPAYAKRARELCDEAGAILIVDDVRVGFRIARDCSWSIAGVEPDLSAWGKSFANGHPISALLGSEKLREAATSIYVTGSFWFSAAPMAAGVRTLQLIRDTDYLERMIALGDRLRNGLDEVSKRRGFGLRQTGPSQVPLIMFDDDPGMGIGYAFCSGLIERGFYFHPWHNMFLTSAMTEDDIDRTIQAADDTLADMQAAPPPAPVEKLNRLAELVA